MRPRLALGVLVALWLAGCATPRASHIVFGPDHPRTSFEDGHEAYVLSKTLIEIDRMQISQTKDATTYQYAVALRVVGDPMYAYGIKPIDRYGVKTNISLIRTPNSQLLQSVNVSIEDKRTEYVASAFKLLTTFGLAVSGVPSAQMASNSAKYPIQKDTLQLLERNQCKRGACSINLITPGSADISATLEVDAVTPDAIERPAMHESIDKARGVIFHSSCRRAYVRLPIDKENQFVQTEFSLADPRYVQVVPLPKKGSVTFHSQCGASTLAEGVQLQSDLDVADSALKELLKLIEAMKKEESKNDSE